RYSLHMKRGLWDQRIRRWVAWWLSRPTYQDTFAPQGYPEPGKSLASSLASCGRRVAALGQPVRTAVQSCGNSWSAGKLFITAGLDRLVPRWQPVCGVVLTLLLLLPIPAFAVNWFGNWVLVSSTNATYIPSGDSLNIYATITSGTQGDVSITLTRQFVANST